MKIEEMIDNYNRIIHISKELLKKRTMEIPEELAKASDIENALENALDEIRHRKANIETSELIVKRLKEALE